LRINVFVFISIDIFICTFFVTQLIESDKLHVKELRTQGYSDNQLRELGFPKIALGQAPAVLKSL
jgi:hypothetical protein